MTDSGSFVKVPNPDEEELMRKAADDSKKRREEEAPPPLKRLVSDPSMLLKQFYIGWTLERVCRKPRAERVDDGP